jgi:hypothetical protein
MTSIAPSPVDTTTEKVNRSAFNRQAGSQMQGNDGGFDITRFPADLGSEQHPHYVMFFINVRESDVGDMQKRSRIEVDDPDSMRMTREGAQVLSVPAGGLGGYRAGVGVADLVLNPLGTGYGAITSVPGVAAGVAGGALGLGLGAGFAGTSRDRVTLAETLALYIAEPPRVVYQAGWATDDLGMAGKGGADLRAVLDKIENGALWTGAKEALESGGQAFSAATLKGMESIKNNILGNVGGAISSGAAITTNPFKTALFQSMGLRSFAFNYSFLPRSLDEYKDVQKIVKTFKKYMHPKLAVGSYILHYPAEFNIVYYYQYDENEHLFKMANCALTDMAVQYGGTDFSTFRDTKGAPTEITMQLKFTELEMMTQKRMEDNY